MTLFGGFGGLALLATMVTLWMLPPSGDAIRCYECNSYTDKRCLGSENVKLDDDLLVTCPHHTPEGKPYVLCRKIKQVIDFEVNGLHPESRIIRKCGWDNSTYHNRCYQRSGFGGRQEVCACDQDICNDGATFTPTLTLLATMAVAMAIM